MSYQRRMEELTRSQCLELMGTVQVGRLVFVHHAMPAVRPVNHLVDRETIVIRATVGAAITEAVTIGSRPMVVAYEADAIDTARQLGWSVIVTGTAELVTDRVAAERYRSLIEPWVTGPADEVITISTEMVHGYRMVPARLADQIDPATSITGRRLPLTCVIIGRLSSRTEPSATDLWIPGRVTPSAAVVSAVVITPSPAWPVPVTIPERTGFADQGHQEDRAPRRASGA